MGDASDARARMVREQLDRRGLRDRAVLAAMGEVPREAFVPARLAASAYDDGPLPIGEGQTISQPYVVAWMAELAGAGPDDVVLEVGTGSGYGAAVLSRIARVVHGVECHETLAASARRRLATLGYGNVHVHVGDGTLGWPQAAPYDAIVVTAGGPRVPPALLAQLAPGGRLVIPVGDPECQQMLRVVAGPDGRTIEEPCGAVRFVPLVGEQGWPGGDGTAR